MDLAWFIELKHHSILRFEEFFPRVLPISRFTVGTGNTCNKCKYPHLAGNLDLYLNLVLARIFVCILKLLKGFRNFCLTVHVENR